MNNIFSYIIFPKTISGNFTSTNSDDPHQFMLLQMFSVTLPQTRLLFFKDIGPVLQTCLTQFQSGAPLVPLIKDEMVQLFTKIMQFFIK